MKSAEIEVNWAMFSDDGLHTAEQKTLGKGTRKKNEKRKHREGNVRVVDQG